MGNARFSLRLLALALVALWASHASAVTDRNLTERGQMPPFADTVYPVIHSNALQQEKYAQGGGPAERTVQTFAEGIVKTLPLVPGASLAIGPSVLPNGNLVAGTGRGIGFSSLTVHDPVTGNILWMTPRYLGPVDYPLQRTVGPWAYSSVPAIDAAGHIYIDDGYNFWSFGPEGSQRWVGDHGALPAGPQRLSEEPLRPRSMNNDFIPTATFAPDAIRSPDGNNLWGGVWSRGNIVWLDTESGQPVIVKSAGNGRSFDAPFLFAVVDLLCFPGGQIALEIQDVCSAALFTRYFSVNTTAIDPVRNRFSFTYAGDGASFDQLKTWAFVTAAGVGEPGTILAQDTNGDGFGDTGVQEVWARNFGLNTGATPTISDTLRVIYSVDGEGVTYAFDAEDGTILSSSAGAGVGFSPSTDHEDQLELCSGALGLSKLDGLSGEILWQNRATGLGLQHIPVVPDAPLVASGRPAAQCSGFASVHRDMVTGQFVLGYPIPFLDTLSAVLPLPTTITNKTTVDFSVDNRTGETVEAQFRSLYNGSAEAQVIPQDSGRFTSTRVEAQGSINAVLMNLLLPSRFDVPPSEGGFVISEPYSYRQAVLSQFETAGLYCADLLDLLPNTGASPEDDQARQIAVNKSRYLSAIMKNSVLGRVESGNDRLPPEFSDVEVDQIETAIDEIVATTDLAVELLLSKAPGEPDAQAQELAELAIEQSCRSIAEIQEKIDVPVPPPGMTPSCRNAPRTVEPTAILSNGWGYDLANTRARDAAETNLSGANIDQLELKWAFVFPFEPERRAPPIVTENAVFAGSMGGGVYAIDRVTGCEIWRAKTRGLVRTGLVMGPGPDSERLIYFGTIGGEVRAIRERDGKLVWRTQILSNREVPVSEGFLYRIANLLSFHRADPTMLTGTPSLHDGVLYVPVSTRESFGAAVPIRPCCFASGSVVALNAQTGESLWRTDTIDERATFNVSTGQWAPAGAGVWNSPTIDPDRRLLYFGTAQNYSRPTSDGTNSVFALDLDTGDVRWRFKGEFDDAWNVACALPLPSLLGRNCPPEEELNRDFDFGSSPILADLPGGGQLLLAGNKGGLVHGLDPDTGALVWRTRVSDGGTLGGVHFGMAYDGSSVYAATTDALLTIPATDNLGDLLNTIFRLDFSFTPTPTGRPGIYALDAASGAEQFVAKSTFINEDGEEQQSPYSAAPSIIPGALLAGSLDGFVRAFSSTDGSLLWEFDTAQTFMSPDGRRGRGGSISVGGPIVAGDMLFIGSGSLIEGESGNVLFAFGLP